MAVAFRAGWDSVSDTAQLAEEQLVELMNSHERRLYAFLLSLTHDSDLALDCAQDTFLRAYQQLSQDKPVTASWLFTVARNRALDEFRRMNRARLRTEKREATVDPVPVEENAAVHRVLEQLAPLDREVLYLHTIAGFKTDEIGEMLGIRAVAVRQRLFRARERFRALYQSEQ